jgi:uncharacterized membrane protein (DUF485 family)
MFRKAPCERRGLVREGFTRSARSPTLPPAGFPVGPATSPKLSGGETMAVNDQNSGLTNEETSVLSNPNFQALVRERSGFGWTLTIIMLVIYFGFILLVAFGKGFLATKIGGGVTSIGMIIGLGVIVSAVVLTGIYTQRANSRYDDLTEKLRRDLAR